ncbi:ATP-binding cassette domain-containing protein [Sphingobacterium sp. Mn56C]|uniref:ATP-binding cassette domain-containing protein n=1 Tax=Sphingobacterium sp. Mn56C TaxID=3395261 RepID=UPI003BE1C7C7
MAVSTIPIADKELYIDSVEFSYSGTKTLLTGVYLNCKVGEVVALLGRNGCGKSTLLKILFGTLKPKNAFIRLNGTRIQQAYASREVCYMPQESLLPTAKTVKRIANLLVNDKNKIAELQANDIIAKIWNSKIADISTGEKRYVEFLLLLAQPATFILLDEPFSGLSPYLQERVHADILALKSEKGFIISDHHFRSVLQISTQIVLLQNGGCRAIADKKDLEFFYVPTGTFDE